MLPVPHLLLQVSLQLLAQGLCVPPLLLRQPTSQLGHGGHEGVGRLGLRQGRNQLKGAARCPQTTALMWRLQRREAFGPAAGASYSCCQAAQGFGI